MDVGGTGDAGSAWGAGSVGTGSGVVALAAGGGGGGGEGPGGISQEYDKAGRKNDTMNSPQPENTSGRQRGLVPGVTSTSACRADETI